MNFKILLPLVLASLFGLAACDAPPPADGPADPAPIDTPME